ncbi:hypothetical protein RchiOBHm_Chr4g0387171 [Rosa chinensis]|uniref:Pentatricopeptide n=1 Tax=Rosa chinensis TaxID=74649 RepID=A0A2P6QPC8_ROSCH|nr:hypothetical protein RchiOBHm_Chr4g0387171 [Rosa chinensis]
MAAMLQLSPPLSATQLTKAKLISTCAEMGTFERCLERDVFIGNSLICFDAECGHLDCARKVFDGMLDRNTASWTNQRGLKLRLENNL